MDDSSPLSFFTPSHHAVRNFVVRELPRNHGWPLTPLQIAKALEFEPGLVHDLLTDLEKHLFFLVRDRRGDVNWAFPITSERTPHRLRFSTGERIYGACAEDSFAAPFIQSRLRKQHLEAEIATSCAHSGREMHITVDDDFRWRIREEDADPRIFLPHIDWSSFRGVNITQDF